MSSRMTLRTASTAALVVAAILGPATIAGAGGSSASTDWGMNAGDRFSVSLYGYSSNMRVTPGQRSGDNFQVTGGVFP